MTPIKYEGYTIAVFPSDQRTIWFSVIGGLDFISKDFRTSEGAIDAAKRMIEEYGVPF